MKKCKVLKMFALSLCLLAVILSIAFVYVYLRYPISLSAYKPFTAKEILPIDSVLTADAVVRDSEELITLVEEIHPYFLLEKDWSAYNQAKKRFLNTADRSMTVSDFQRACASFLAFFTDGHTSVLWNEEEYLDVDWFYDRDGLYLENGKKVKTVCSVPAEQVFQEIRRIFPIENKMAYAQKCQDYSKGLFLLKMAGADLSGAPSIALEDGSNMALKVTGVRETPYSSQNSCKFIEDIFYVDFNTCEDNHELKKIAGELKKAVGEGTSKVIVDVRDNGGGNSNACERLLRAMGMRAPSYDIFVRFSPYAKETVGYLRSSGSMTVKGSQTAKKNENVRLAVLTNRYTFSSATMMAVYVRDGGLGAIIGEASGNKPCNYGDIIQFQLDNSRICGSISHKRFLRPDREKYEEDMLVPDIGTVNGEDALEKAVEWMNR